MVGDLDASLRTDLPDRRKMVELAYTDSLTGLSNRRHLEERLTRLIAERNEDPAPFAFAILDLDGFKPINDLFGHAAGDEILAQIGRRLKSCVPAGATTARLGGDEFAFIFPLVFDARNALIIGEAIRDVLTAPYDLGDRTVRLSGSFGFSIYPYGGRSVEDLMGSADSALYRSKRKGRSQITVYSTEIALQMKRATQIEQALRRAITTGDVKPYYQPVVEIETGALVGFEALARWDDPELGIIPPDIFVTLAEERGFITSLSDMLLAQAARAARRWPKHLFLAFNLSSVQLMDPTTGLNLLSSLAKANLDPRRLELEITETAIVADPATAHEIVAQLRAAGIRISLDDFGTGQSSLARLRDFDFDKLKIDRSFIQPILEDTATEHIVRAIVAMCDGLDLKVVAEGIEDTNQARMLRQLGCKYGQGYLYGKAMTAQVAQRYATSNTLDEASPKDASILRAG